jgi:hypothetical protein
MSRALILIEVVEQNFNPYLGHDPNSPPGLHGRKKKCFKINFPILHENAYSSDGFQFKLQNQLIQLCAVSTLHTTRILYILMILYVG